MKTPPFVTDATLRVLEFIREYIKVYGWAPTVREICKGLNLNSTSTAHWHLHNLEEQQYIVRVKGSPRAIRILEKGDRNA